MNGLNGYICTYRSKQIEVYSKNMFTARAEAEKQFKPKKSDKHTIGVYLCERADGTEVLQSTCF